MTRTAISVRSETTTEITEQRRHHRRRERREGWLQLPTGEVYPGATVDISAGGLSVLGLGLPCQVGDRVRVCLSNPSAMEEEWFLAVVRWRSPERIGLELQDHPRVLRRWQQIIR